MRSAGHARWAGKWSSGKEEVRADLRSEARIGSYRRTGAMKLSTFPFTNSTQRPPSTGT